MQSEGKNNTHTKKHPHTALTVSPCPLSYPVLSHSEQDSLLSLSGPSDPCGPHPLQRSPEAQQVHASRNLTSTKTSLILTSRPLRPYQGQGAAVCWCLECVCVVLGKWCGGKKVCVCVCVCEITQIISNGLKQNPDELLHVLMHHPGQHVVTRTR